MALQKQPSHRPSAKINPTSVKKSSCTDLLPTNVRCLWNVTITARVSMADNAFWTASNIPLSSVPGGTAFPAPTTAAGFPKRNPTDKRNVLTVNIFWVAHIRIRCKRINRRICEDVEDWEIVSGNMEEGVLKLIIIVYLLRKYENII